MIDCLEGRQMLGVVVHFGVGNQEKELEADQLHVMYVQESR